MSLQMALRPLLMCSALCVASHIAFAQPKVAVVNMQAAVFGTAEIKKADAALQVTLKPRTDRAQELQADVASIAQQLQNPSKLSDAQQEELSARGTREQREFTHLQQDLQDEATRAREEIIPKITEKMVEVVKKLAAEKGLDLVVDSANVVFRKDAMDLTTEAVAAYDKANPAAAPAPAPKK